jgi:glycine betaine/choline ABC-type transport system substrate-binding protein
MKLLITIAAIIFSTQVFSENVICRAEKYIQENEAIGMKTDANISFTLNKKTKELTNIIGHIFVQQVFIENEDIDIYNSYLGFFMFDKVSHNPNYRPIRYKDYTQFKKFDAIHTAGLENGMWGEFVRSTSTLKHFSLHSIQDFLNRLNNKILIN